MRCRELKHEHLVKIPSSANILGQKSDETVRRSSLDDDRRSSGMLGRQTRTRPPTAGRLHRTRRHHRRPAVHLPRRRHDKRITKTRVSKRDNQWSKYSLKQVSGPYTISEGQLLNGAHRSIGGDCVCGAK